MTTEIEKAARCNTTQFSAVLQIWKGSANCFFKRDRVDFSEDKKDKKSFEGACASEAVRDCRGRRTETMWVGTRTRPAFWATARS